PLLFTVSILGAPHTQGTGEPILAELLWTIAPALAALVSLLLLGRLILRPLFHLVAAAKSTELSMAAGLLVVAGPAVATAAPGLIVGFVLGLIAVKAAIIFLLARAFRLGTRLAGEVALVLAPGGEFAFVMIGAAIASKVVPAPMGGEVMIVVTLSMFALPLLGLIGAKLGPRQAPDEAALAALAPEADIGAGRVIIVGY